MAHQSIVCKWCVRENCTYDCPPNSTCEHFIGSIPLINEIEDTQLATKCLLCGDEVTIGMHDSSTQVCEHCKKAFLTLREIIENTPEEEVNRKIDATITLLNYEQNYNKRNYATGNDIKGEPIENAYNYFNNDYTE